MVGAVLVVLRGGLESRIQPAGPVSKAQQRWRQQAALLRGAGGGFADTNQGTGGEQGMVMFGAEMSELDFNPLVTVNTSAVYQRPGNWGSQRKTRLMSTQGSGGWLCYSLAKQYLQFGPRLG